MQHTSKRFNSFSARQLGGSTLRPRVQFSVSFAAWQDVRLAHKRPVRCSVVSLSHQYRLPRKRFYSMATLSSCVARGLCIESTRTYLGFVGMGNYTTNRTTFYCWKTVQLRMTAQNNRRRERGRQKNMLIKMLFHQRQFSVSFPFPSSQQTRMSSFGRDVQCVNYIFVDGALSHRY